MNMSTKRIHGGTAQGESGKKRFNLTCAETKHAFTGHLLSSCASRLFSQPLSVIVILVRCSPSHA